MAQHCVDIVGAFRRERQGPFILINIAMIGDDLATQGSWASAALALAQVYRYILVSAPGGLKPVIVAT